MTNTPHLTIPLLYYNQAQKEITVNEAILTIDALLNPLVKDVGLNSPPSDPINGDVYIIGKKPENEWAGKPYFVAYFYYSWRFIRPNEGLELWVVNRKKKYFFDGDKWKSIKYIFSEE